MVQVTGNDILKELTDPRLEPVARRVLDGERLSPEDGELLFETPDLLSLGRLATVARMRKSRRTTWYIVNRHVNYSNVCENRCGFCAFHRAAGDPGAYTMTVDEVVAEAEEARDSGATELHIVGGCHPELPLGYYTDMLSRVRDAAPAVHLQAFTAVEVDHMARRAGRSIREVLAELKAAGLGSLPGGGAEVFAPRVRSRTCPEKLPGEGWLGVMREAHGLGLPSNATMLYGHVETAAEKVAHMIALRELQDETGGFMSFIPLAFHPANTPMAAAGDVPADGGTTALEDLRAVALGRLMLDNFPHVKAFWIMLGLGLSQVSQHFGADDLDGTVIRERITHAAGAATPEAVTVDTIRELILEAGFEPQERNTVYRSVLRDGLAWHLA